MSDRARPGTPLLPLCSGSGPHHLALFWPVLLCAVLLGSALWLAAQLLGPLLPGMEVCNVQEMWSCTITGQVKLGEPDATSTQTTLCAIPFNVCKYTQTFDYS